MFLPKAFTEDSSVKRPLEPPKATVMQEEKFQIKKLWTSKFSIFQKQKVKRIYIFELWSSSMRAIWKVDQLEILKPQRQSDWVWCVTWDTVSL